MPITFASAFVGLPIIDDKPVDLINTVDVGTDLYGFRVWVPLDIWLIRWQVTVDIETASRDQIDFNLDFLEAPRHRLIIDEEMGRYPRTDDGAIREIENVAMVSHKVKMIAGVESEYLQYSLILQWVLVEKDEIFRGFGEGEGE